MQLEAVKAGYKVPEQPLLDIKPSACDEKANDMLRQMLETEGMIEEELDDFYPRSANEFRERSLEMYNRREVAKSEDLDI